MGLGQWITRIVHRNAGSQRNTVQASSPEVNNEGWLVVGDYALTAAEREQWKRQGWRPSFIQLSEEALSSLSENQRQSTAREFVHDGAPFFQRGYIHYALQLWREAIRIDSGVDPGDCGYDNEIVLAVLAAFQAERHGSKIQRGASDVLYQWISNLPSADLFLTHSKYAGTTRCPYCNTPGTPQIWPPGGDAVPFYCCRLEECHSRPGGYVVDATCRKCARVWCVVWDDDPIWNR